LSFGLAEDLMTDLSRSRDLSVLSRSATFGYRDGNDDPAARLHRDLDATHVVDGSLQKDGERIRISVQLVDASTGSSIWAERFDRRIEGLFELQDEVRLRILEALSAELQFDGRETHTTGTTDVSAYDLLLRGRYLEASDTRKNTLEAIRLYKRAIDVDPSYSDAYARLSNMYELSSRSGWSISPEGDRALALEMAERAVRLDPDNPFAHWTRGRVISRLDDGEDATKRAVAALDKALELEPDYSDAYAYLALVYIGVGQVEAAVDAIDTAFRINPEPRSWYFRNRGVISYFKGEYEAAIEDFERASEINSIAHASRTWMAAALAKAGRTEDAEWEMAESIVAGVPDSAAEFLDSHGFIRDSTFRAALLSGLYAAGMAE
jgi:TolB-like protein/Flp pilus assembly protein TadD